MRAPAAPARPGAHRLAASASLFASPERVVALRGVAGARRGISAARFARDAAQLARRLAGSAGARHLVVVDDAYALAVALLALWRQGCVAVLPPNGEPGTLTRLAPGVAGALSDRPALLASGARAPLGPESELPDESEALAFWREAPALDPDAFVCELFTSGTSGDEKPVVKRLRHLDDEVACLEATLGPGLDGAVVLGTASPLHLYGLLFRVLWPLVGARPLDAETWLQPAELVARAASEDAFVLVSTPAHLKRLARHDGLASLRPACRAVFSSGGALDGETAELVTRALGGGVTEIYGSTETGGVARRVRRDAGEAPAWTPMPGVTVTRDAATGRALVRSPFVSGGAEDGAGDAELLTGDAIAPAPGGGFQLEGRSDRVVKVGEKRLALPELEARLRAHPYVDDARGGLVARGGEMRVAVAVVASAEGAAALEREGRRAVVSALQQRLAGEFDRVLLPRAFRFVRELPADDRGKTTASALQALFAEAELEPASEPELVSERREGDRIERRLRVPEELVFFDGHFPGHPVVPGVALLRFALDAAETLLGREPVLAGIERLKFHEQVRPGDELLLELTLDRAVGVIEIAYRAGERRVATGRARLADAAGAAT